MPHHRCRWALGPPPAATARGFTLIEVLVALAVVAVALAAGIRAAGSVTHGAQRLGDVTAAQWCADNQLAGLRLAQQFPGVGDSRFDCQGMGRQYQGVLSTTTTPNPNFRLVSASVVDGDGHVLVRLSTVLGRY